MIGESSHLTAVQIKAWVGVRVKVRNATHWKMYVSLALSQTPVYTGRPRIQG